MENKIEVMVSLHIKNLTKHTIDMMRYSKSDHFEKASIKKMLIKELNSNFLSHLLTQHSIECNDFCDSFFVNLQQLPTMIFSNLKAQKND